MKLPYILSGTEIIIPVSLLTKISNPQVTIEPSVYLINSFLSYSVYKFDRYRDAQEYNNYDTTKLELYNSVLDNRKITELFIFCSIIGTLTLLIHEQLSSILPVYLSTFLYKNIKQLDIPVKPIYVATLWTISTCLIPNYPDISVYYLSTFLNIFALTNLADIRDYDEDILENVSSIPTIYGINNTYSLCILSSTLSSYIIYNSPNFKWSFESVFMLLANFIPYFTP